MKNLARSKSKQINDERARSMLKGAQNICAIYHTRLGERIN